MYFFASWCPYCGKDFAALDTVYPTYKERVDFIAIDLDLNEDEDLIRRYRAESRHTVDFAAGQEQILRDYSVTRTTTKYAISKDGIILWKGSGELDEKTWEIIFKGLAG